MKTILAHTPIVDFEGIVVPMAHNNPAPFTIGKAMANCLIVDQSKQFDPFKLWDLGRRLYHEGTVVLDDADFTGLKKILTGTTAYNAMVTGQLLEACYKVEAVDAAKPTDTSATPLHAVHGAQE